MMYSGRRARRRRLTPFSSVPFPGITHWLIRLIKPAEQNGLLSAAVVDHLRHTTGRGSCSRNLFPVLSIPLPGIGQLRGCTIAAEQDYSSAPAVVGHSQRASRRRPRRINSRPLDVIPFPGVTMNTFTALTKSSEQHELFSRGVINKARFIPTSGFQSRFRLSSRVANQKQENRCKSEKSFHKLPADDS